MARRFHSSPSTSLPSVRRRPERPAALAWAALLLVAVSGWQAPRALAADPVKAEVLVILAKQTEGNVDPQLEGIEALRQPPFNTFKSMKVLAKPSVKLSEGKPVRVELPNGRTLQLELQKRMDDGRFKVRVSINRPGEKKDYLPLLQVMASPGEPFFVAGQKYQGGTLVIGVQVGKKG